MQRRIKMGMLKGTRVCECHKQRKKPFLARFKEGTASVCRAAALSSLVVVSALAAQIPSKIMFTPGVDLYKEAVRNYLKSNPISTYSSEKQMGINSMSVISAPYFVLDPSSGMTYNVWISHGFYYAGGDSLKYVIKYAFNDFRTSLRDRKWAWELNSGTIPHTNISWSSGHPSYIPSGMGDASQFPIMQCSMVLSADLVKMFDRTANAVIDTFCISLSIPSVSFNHAWNYGFGNWGNKRRWLGISSADMQNGAVSFYPGGSADNMHQLVRPYSNYPVPKPGSTDNHFLAWVGDTVFWKINPADTNAPYDVSARVDSVRFVFAELDQHMWYLSNYALNPGEASSVTTKPYDVFRLPVPERLVPFTGYGGRKGALVNPGIQFANIAFPFNSVLHTLSIPELETMFFQDSTVRTGPWYTLMKGRARFGGTAEDGTTYKMVTDSTTPQLCADSLVMWRFIKVPAPGDTAFLTLGDESSTQFRVPDSLYGAKYPYDPLICGFLYGKDYTAVNASIGQGRALLLPGQARPVGQGRYEIIFGDNAPHRVSVIDMRGRAVGGVTARSKATIDLGRMGLPPGIYIISLSERGRAMPITAAYVR
jgi:hypothetical protein